MSTAPSHRTRTRIEWLALFVAALCACGVAQAKQSDKDQPININASSFAGSQDSGKIVFTGSVTLDQGTFKADGSQATGYTDPDDTSQWQRVVLVGSPAHFQQTQDNGTLVHGQGATIDYKVSENTVILTGNAVVVQQGQGEFHGEKLVYNTDTGEIQGSPVAGGRVHITLRDLAAGFGHPAGKGGCSCGTRLRRSALPGEVDLFAAELGKVEAGEGVSGIAIFAAVHRRHRQRDPFPRLHVERLAECLAERAVGTQRSRAVGQDAEEVWHAAKLCGDGGQGGLRSFRRSFRGERVDAGHDGFLSGS